MSQKQMMVEMSVVSIDGAGWYYASLYLPATDYEIRDALERLRMIPKRDTVMTVNVYNCDLISELDEIRLDSNNIEEINYLANRLAALNSDERCVFKAILPKYINFDEEPLSIKDLINCTFGLEKVSVISHVSSYRELGEFVIENDLSPLVSNVPENARYLLDKHAIGKAQCEANGGVFSDGRYIVTGDYELPKVYDGKTLPFAQDKTDWVFRFLVVGEYNPFSEESVDTGEWIEFTIDKSVADDIAQKHDTGDLEKCRWVEYETTIPQIEEPHFDSDFSFDSLNRLALKIKEMSPSDQIKLKAILSASMPSGIETALKAADSINEFEFENISRDSGTFFKNYIAQKMDAGFDIRWLERLNAYIEGDKLLKKLGASATDYGTVSAKGRSLYEIVPFDDEALSENTESQNNGASGISMGGIKL